MSTTTHNTEHIPYTGEVGCLVEGHWGRYGVLRVIEIARGYGWDSDEIDMICDLYEHGDEDEELEPSYHVFDAVADAGTEAENWLNEHVAQDDHSFGWNTGEFYYEPTAWWREQIT